MRVEGAQLHGTRPQPDGHRADGREAVCAPRPDSVADCGDLPEWQRETDADIFEEIGRTLR